MVHFGRWTQFHYVSRYRNKPEHTEAWRGPRPPGRADFVAENWHDRRLSDTGRPVKKKTEPPPAPAVQVQYIGDTNGSKHG